MVFLRRRVLLPPSFSSARGYLRSTPLPCHPPVPPFPQPPVSFVSDRLRSLSLLSVAAMPFRYDRDRNAKAARSTKEIRRIDNSQHSYSSPCRSFLRFVQPSGSFLPAPVAIEFPTLPEWISRAGLPSGLSTSLVRYFHHRRRRGRGLIFVSSILRGSKFLRARARIRSAISRR